MPTDSSKKKIVIIGSGPTGLGAALRLEDVGHKDYIILDKAPEVGGLSRTYKDDKGFLWDLGGHVLFSHYDYFDQAMDRALGDEWLHHQRISHVWVRDRFVPYPFQNNINALPKEDVVKCIMGIVETQRKEHKDKASTFEDWILRQFGQGIADIFMVPYNFKVWAYHPRKMACQWMGERVATIDLERVVSNVVHDKEDAGWGPNATFRFPKEGGTGGIWTNLAKKCIPQEKFRLNSTVVSVDREKKILQLADGEEIHYDYLISTMPLDILVQNITPPLPDLIPHTKKLVHSSTHVIGLGMRGPRPEQLAKCWMYFPEDNCPFYRATVFSNYSPNNVPETEKPCWSLLLEVSESPDKPVDLNKVVDLCEQGARNAKLLDDSHEVISRWNIRLEYGYPTPSLERDEALEVLQPKLREMDILSRGRFGGWKYEVGNQDHSFMQGAEAVNNILYGHHEDTYFTPSVVNNPKNRAQNSRHFVKA